MFVWTFENIKNNCCKYYTNQVISQLLSCYIYIFKYIELDILFVYSHMLGTLFILNIIILISY